MFLNHPVAIASPSKIARATAVSRLALPALNITSSIQQRSVASTTLSQSSADEILVQQRLRRPVAPHLTIYQPQITWILSGLNRITGVSVSGGLYVFALAYLASPLLGWHLESASLAAAVATWPFVVKVGAKFLVALPFTFHSLNGLRHLAWDTGRELSNKAVQRTGWMVVGGTFLGSGMLAYM